MAWRQAIDAVLAALQSLSAEHFGVPPDAVQWPHAGSLGHVAVLLRDVCAFLSSDFTDDHQSAPSSVH